MNYERLSHVEHILKRPDSYVGSLPPETGKYWVRDGSGSDCCSGKGASASLCLPGGN